jgi:hypothetical protein
MVYSCPEFVKVWGFYFGNGSGGTDPNCERLSLTLDRCGCELETDRLKQLVNTKLVSMRFALTALSDKCIWFNAPRRQVVIGV